VVGADAIAVRATGKPHEDPQRGALVWFYLSDGTMITRASDLEGGTYPIGRRFAPALP
jgi:hypothetical protein